MYNSSKYLKNKKNQHVITKSQDFLYYEKPLFFHAFSVQFWRELRLWQDKNFSLSLLCLSCFVWPWEQRLKRVKENIKINF